MAELHGSKNATIGKYLVGQYIDQVNRRPKQTVKQMARIFANYARLHNAYRAQQKRKQGQQPSQTDRSAT